MNYAVLEALENRNMMLTASASFCRVERRKAARALRCDYPRRFGDFLRNMLVRKRAARLPWMADRPFSGLRPEEGEP
jgi:hypothetical protein